MHFADACVHGELPACSVACPLNLDVREMIRHIQRGDFTAAYRTYGSKAVFPGIVSRVCDEPCANACVRQGIDDSVRLRLLERACVQFTKTRAIAPFNLPPKQQRIAVFGAGLAGLACAVRLGAKSYSVTVYERRDVIGGRLWDLLDPNDFLPELQAQVAQANCELELRAEISSLEQVQYDVALIATGKDGASFGMLKELDLRSYGTKLAGLFLVGNLLGTTPVEDVAQGVIAAHSIEKFIKVGAMDGISETFRQTESPLRMDLSHVARKEAQRAAGEAYTKGQAVAEAERCLRCDCTRCSDVCELFGSLGRMPKDLVSSAMASLHTRAAMAGQQATRAMSSCNLCGLCARVCPEHIDMGQFFADFRGFKREDTKLPPAFHDFFLRDMESANDEAYLARAAPGHQLARYLFFPGCQLAASDPRYVEVTYHHLLEQIGDIAIMLACCGAPAEWAADTGLSDSVARRIAAEWERFGRPQFVFACPTCKRQLERHLPGITGVSLYTVLLHQALPTGLAETEYDACMFDPCGSRYDAATQSDVRQLIELAGLRLTELPHSRDDSQCCGWGGHIAAANPRLFSSVARARASADPRAYVTYCINCRDTLRGAGKDCRHVLDVVFGLDDGRRHLPSLGQRRRNRIIAKNGLLQREWGVATPQEKKRHGMPRVRIAESLLAKMSNKFMLEEDIERTVVSCEASGELLYYPSRQLHVGHLRIGNITYWVEYMRDSRGITVTNAYSHRVAIVD